MAATDHAERGRAQVREKLDRLHRDGVVDLDAPLRNAIPELARRIEASQRVRLGAGDVDAEAFRITEWYCLIGSAGFVCSLKWEV